MYSRDDYNLIYEKRHQELLRGAERSRLRAAASEAAQRVNSARHIVAAVESLIHIFRGQSVIQPPAIVLNMSGEPDPCFPRA